MQKGLIIAVEVCAVILAAIMVMHWCDTHDALCVTVAIMFIVCAIIAHNVQRTISWGE